jgi:hypothetical protein
MKLGIVERKAAKDAAGTVTREAYAEVRILDDSLDAMFRDIADRAAAKYPVQAAGIRALRANSILRTAQSKALFPNEAAGGGNVAEVVEEL